MTGGGNNSNRGGRGGRGRGGRGGRGGSGGARGKGRGDGGHRSREDGPRVPKGSRDAVRNAERAEWDRHAGHAQGNRSAANAASADKVRTSWRNRGSGDSDGSDDDGGGHRPLRGTAKPRRETRRDSGGQGRRRAKRELFKEYLGDAELKAGLEDGSLVKGRLRVNARNFREAYVTVEGFTRDLHVEGTTRRNRAFNGDTVVVRILPSDADKPKRRAKREESPAITAAIAAANAAIAAKGGDSDRGIPDAGGSGRADADADATADADVSIAATEPSVLEESDLSTMMSPGGRPATGRTSADADADDADADADGADADGRGRAGEGEEPMREAVVVGVLACNHIVNLAGRIMKFDPENDRFAQFHPLDKRYPFVFVPSEELRVLRREDVDKDILEVKLAGDWSSTARFPRGTFVRAIGRAGDIVAETTAILASNGISWDEPFADEVIADLPEVPGGDDGGDGCGDDGEGAAAGGKGAPWAIPDEELANPMREDLRHLRVVSVDPETARDLDDALSITKTDDGLFEVGVHIADVSYFVAPHTALDAVAATRTTSTYLVQRVIPMLPGLLSQDLCSLNPGVDRLAFSAIMTLDAEGNVVRERFTRSVIRSDCRLSYHQAQRMIEGKYSAEVLADPGTEYDWKVEEGECTRAQVVGDIKQLHRLAKTMRKRRFDAGAVRINKTKLHFKLDPATGDPVEVTGYPIHDANRMIEEFMLLANMRVAHRISEAYPEVAMLRRHPPPLDRGLEKMVESLKAAGYAIDVSTTKKFMESLSNPDIPAEVRDILHIIVARPMRPAAYFCTGDPAVEAPDGWRHWALNATHYTHFTSPIRRYPDVVVHRQLYASLLEDRIRAGALDKDAEEDLRARIPDLHPMVELTEIAERCNENKLNAKKASEMSGVLYLCLLLKDKGAMRCKASVFDLWDGGLAIVIREYTLEYRLRSDALHADAYTYSPKSHTATIVNPKVVTPAAEGAESAQPKVEIIPGEHVVKIFDEVNVELVVRTDRTPMDFAVRFLGFVKGGSGDDGAVSAE